MVRTQYKCIKGLNVVLQLLPKGTGRAGANTPYTELLSTQHAQHTLVPTCQVADFTESHILTISFLSPEATDPILEAHGTDIRAVYRSVLRGPHGIISKYCLSSWHLKLSRFYIKLWTYSPSWKKTKNKKKIRCGRTGLEVPLATNVGSELQCSPNTHTHTSYPGTDSKACLLRPWLAWLLKAFRCATPAGKLPESRQHGGEKKKK